MSTSDSIVSSQTKQSTLVDPFRQRIKHDHHQRRFRRQLKLQAARCLVVRFIQQQIAHLHPFRQILLHADH